MKIVIILLSILIILVVCFMLYKMRQLKNLNKMTLRDMLTHVTEGEGTYVSMAVIENGELTYHTYGRNGAELPDVDFDFEIGSITKTMTALLISKAVSEGKMALSDSISKYLDLPEGKHYPTVEQLLTHTSGYKGHYLNRGMVGNLIHRRNGFYRVGKDKILSKVRSLSIKDRDYPFVYSNFGFSVLGLVIEAVYKRDYTELLTECLHTELLMTNTSVAACSGNLGNYWDWAKGDGYISAGAVISTITDMAKYLDFYMSCKMPYVELLLKGIKMSGVHNRLYESMGIHLDVLGMSWIFDTKHHNIWHNGGTSHYNSYIAFSEDRKRGIVILSNYAPNVKIPVMILGSRFMNGSSDWDSISK